MSQSSHVIPLHCEPIVWAIVGFGTAAEVLVDRMLMRWLRVETRCLTGRLILIQISTWCAVLAFLGGLMLRGKDLDVVGLVLLELIIVVVEVALLRIASGISREGRPGAPLGVSTAIALSVVGNVVGAASVVGAMLLVRLLLE